MTTMRENILEQPKVLRNLLDKDHIGYYRSLADEAADYKRVVMVGMGSSHFAARAASFAWAKRLGIKVDFMSAAEFAYYASLFGSVDFAVLISQSGESFETREALFTLKKSGTRIWGLTNSPESTLGSQSDRVIPMDAGPEAGSSTKTYTASLMCLLAIASARNDACLGELMRVPDLVSAVIEENAIIQLSDALQAVRSLSILGMGPNIATALESALILREKTYHHAEGNSASEFRHGPIESVDPGDLVIGLVGPEGPSHELSMIHFGAIEKVGGRVLRIGGPRSVSPLLSDLSLSEEASVIPMIIPFQIVGEYLAGAMGYDVDGFKYMTKVTDKY